MRYPIQSVTINDPNHAPDRMHLQGEPAIGRFLSKLYHWLYKKQWTQRRLFSYIVINVKEKRGCPILKLMQYQFLFFF